MKIEETYSTLKKIRNKYTEVIHLTETLHYNLRNDRNIKTINQRAELLNEIENEHSILMNDCPQWQDYCKVDSKCITVKNEIKLLIALVLSLDDTLKEMLTNKINIERGKINVLNKRAKMALSYAKF
ncbi:MAG: hypothetical protein PVI26_03445 [Chitinispirillia bacterium]|jgi:hypothetical protein